jgi:hypothetical protein
MRVTDDPVGSIYRLQVLDVASVQPHFIILCSIVFDNHSPFVTEELIHA